MKTSPEAVKSLLADGTMVTIRELVAADYDQVVALHEAMPTKFTMTAL